MDEHMAGETRRKQILYRANHRGIKEMDIILGGYASAHLSAMRGEDLDLFEAIMEESDRDLLKWFTGEEALPERMDTPLFRAILDHTVNNIDLKR